MFPNTSLHNLPFLPTTDHCPILLYLGQIQHNQTLHKCWRFECWWSTLPSFKEAIFVRWINSNNLEEIDWPKFSQHLLQSLHSWSRNHPNNFRSKIQNLWIDLEAAHNRNDADAMDPNTKIPLT